ncbi:MAG TPA: helix-turn-helix transcriptional regulator [Candidatus Coprocola pullicola]|mgnify:CR=1 FL=1|nr:helix-turn-helix transcriptional regulator [Candidatus Coprocola pullicola]
MELYLVLKALRMAKKDAVSQQRIANKLGISRSTYAKYETGERIPPVWVLKKIAEYFDVSLADLLELQEKE